MLLSIRRTGKALRVRHQKFDLNELMDRISRGDRSAFAALFDQTCTPVRNRLEAAGPHEAVLAATYVEVWWLAGCRTAAQQDVVAWIDEIARRRAAGRPADSGYAVRELADLLGRPAATLGSGHGVRRRILPHS